MSEINRLEISESTIDLTQINLEPITITSIDRLPSAEIDYDTFFRDYMAKNRPVIITSISNNWHCSQKWVNLSTNQVNFQTLRDEIDNTLVPVANCSSKYFNSHEKREILFHDFLDYWEKSVKSSHSLESDLLYLKDWHLQQIFPSSFYTTPQYFASDWLNEYLIESGKDDYRFVYMGPKNSWTPLHSDVFSSFSWSTNIFGRKRWIFFPLNEEVKLMNNLKQLPFSVDNFSELVSTGIRFYDITQQPNESIFVPSGWFHQVWNLDDTISINHNWFNGSQINRIWDALKANYYMVLKEIDDCRDMEGFEEHAQVMLRVSYGMNFEDFVDILEFIGLRRIKSTLDKNPVLNFKCYEFGPNHVKYDLMAINRVTDIMLDEKQIFNNINLDRIKSINIKTKR